MYHIWNKTKFLSLSVQKKSIHNALQVFFSYLSFDALLLNESLSNFLFTPNLQDAAASQIP